MINPSFNDDDAPTALKDDNDELSKNGIGSAGDDGFWKRFRERISGGGNDDDNTKEVEEEKKKKKEPEYEPVAFFKLFRFASLTDNVLLVIGLLGAVICGLGLPAMVILFGRVVNTFVYEDLDPNLPCESETVGEACCTDDGKLNLDKSSCNITMEDVAKFADSNANSFMDGIGEFGIGMSIVGLVTFVTSYAFVAFLNYAADNQVGRIRVLFLRSSLRQNVGWYDTKEAGGFAVKMTEDLNKLQEGMGEKVGMFVYFITTFFVSIILAFCHGWELTLVMLSTLPVMMVASGIIAKSQSSLTENELAAYEQAGKVAEEALGSIRTVVAFGGQRKEAERFERNLGCARKAATARGVLTGIGTAVTYFIMFASYGLAFWFGVKLIADEREECLADLQRCHIRYDPGSLLIVFFSIIMGGMNLGQAAPYAEAFTVAKVAAGAIFHVIDRVPAIDSSSDRGKKPSEASAGNVVLSNVCFNYPSRPDVKVLRGIDITIRKGETVALVGASGCGKSTVIQLVQRFYDPQSGSVSVDGTDIKDLNLKWLRERIGVVGQEPVLFGCTIAENVRFGKESVTMKEIEEACVKANAHDFVSKLPMKYDTLVGERGAQLSGGQKQRIAIARALVRNPEILLLDEATSALDTQSESVVREALDKARAGRTTIVVAHRLSTVRNAGKIVVLKDGRVVEIGSHDELMERGGGVYRSLVETQCGNDDDVDVATAESEEVVAVVGDRQRKKVASDDDDDDAATSEPFAAKQAAENDDEDVKRLSRSDTLRLFKLNADEWPLILIGVVSSMLMGGSMPFYGILFGDVLGVLSKSSSEAKSGSEFYSLLFLALAVAVGIVTFLQGFAFSVAGARLTMRVRKLAFEAMLRQEMGWFDESRNSTGALCGRLSNDAGAVQGATGNRVGNVAQAAFTIVLAVSIAVYFNWKLGLVASLFVPVLLVGIVAQAKIIASHGILEREALETSTKVAIEAISNIRTVAGLGIEDNFSKLYSDALNVSNARVKRKAHVRGLVFGFSQSSIFFVYGACMAYGGYLVENEDLPYADCFKVAEGLVASSFIVGQAVAFSPDYSKAIAAAVNIFKLLDRKPLIDSESETGSKLKSLEGNVNFRDARFGYPTRREVDVLRDVNLSVGKGRRVALVGPSGCGKSTCVQLLQRLYDLDGGEITVDDNAIGGISVPSLRSKMGIVSQEPSLFDRTIAENIMYGDNENDVSMDRVVEAARKANIHSFVASLPQAYETRVGEKGVQLSGGQKQRIAIARALVRNPAIILLDEATSALDVESEKVVQEALDEAQEGRTSIIIAHRLVTIQSADNIFVMERGRVLESGTHSLLLRSKGLYSELWSRQAGVEPAK